MSFARKRARFSRKAEEKAMLREQQYNNAEEGERMSGKCRPHLKKEDFECDWEIIEKAEG